MPPHRLLKMDRLSEKIGLAQMLQKGGISEPVSWLVGNTVYWVVLISFIIMGLDAFKIPAVENLLQEFWFYVPNVIAAAIILMAGYLLWPEEIADPEEVFQRRRPAYIPGKPGRGAEGATVSIYPG